MNRDYKVRDYYNAIDNNNLYKGTSFRCTEWADNTKYYNNDKYVDFVTHENCLLVCKQTHISDGYNRPVIVNNGSPVLQDTTYWSMVIAGGTQLTPPVIPTTTEAGQILTSTGEGNKMQWMNPSSTQFQLDCDYVDTPENVYAKLEKNNNDEYVLKLGIYVGKDGVDGKDGTDGAQGTPGDTVQYIYQLSESRIYSGDVHLQEAFQVDNYCPDNWSLSLLETTGDLPYQFESRRERKNGIWGAFSEPVVRNQYVNTLPSKKQSFIFCRVPNVGNNPTISNPTGGTYDNPMPTDPGLFEYMGKSFTPTWSDGIPSGSGNIWRSSAIFTEFSASNVLWTTPVLMMDSHIRQVEYFGDVADTVSIYDIKKIEDSAFNFGTFTNENLSLEDREIKWREFIADKGITWWSDVHSIDTVYMAECTSADNGATWSDWKVIRIKGENGANISPKGIVDKLPNCNEYKLGDSIICNDHLYIHNGDCECDDNCCWVDFGYQRGNNVYIKYADVTTEDVNGSTIDNISISGKSIRIKFTEDNTTGSYIGTMLSGETASNKVSDYTWQRWRGEDGWGYEYIYVATSGANAPDHIDTSERDSANRTMQDDGYIPKVYKSNKALTVYDDSPGINNNNNKFVWRSQRKRVNGVWENFTDFKLHQSWARSIDKIVDYYAWSDQPDYKGSVQLQYFYKDGIFLESVTTTDEELNTFNWTKADNSNTIKNTSENINQWLHNVTITLYDIPKNNSIADIAITTLYRQAADGKAITDITSYYKLSEDNILNEEDVDDSWSKSPNLEVSVDYPYLFEKVATTVSNNDALEIIWSPAHIISTYNAPGYMTYKFMASNTAPQAPQNDAAEGWFDAPIIPGRGETLYVTSKMIYDDGKIRDNTWSDPNPLVDSNVFQVEYSNDYTGGVLPNLTSYLTDQDPETAWRKVANQTGCGTWSNSSDNSIYMAICQISGAVASDWTVMKVRGEDAYHLELSNDVDQIYVVEGNIQKTQVVSTTAQVFCGGSPEEGWKYSCDFGKFNDNQWTYTYDQNDEAKCEDVIIKATKNDVELTKIFKIICLSSSNDYDLKLNTGIVHVNKNWGFSHNTIDVNITQTTIGAEGDTKILTEWNNLTVKYRIDNNAEISLEGKQITLTNLSSPQKITVNLYQGETLIDTAYVEFIYDGKDGADGTGIDIVGSYGTIAELEIAFSDGSITQDSTGLNKGDAFIVNGNLLYVYTDNGDTFDEAFECIDYAGEDGYSNEQIFILSSTEPDCPSYDGIDTSVWNAIDYIPTGWSDTPLTPTKYEDCYVAVRKNNGSETQTHIAFHGKRVGDNYSTKAILYSNYAKDGQDSTVPGPQGTSITNVAVYYCKIGSSVDAPDTGDNLIDTQWHSTVKWEQGQYIWSSIRTQLSDGTVTWSKPVCVTGFKGDSGTSSTLTHQYAISTSYSTFTAYNGSTWSSTCPTVPNGTYLWIRISINGVVSSQYCASGEKGAKGDYGKMIYPAGYYNVETQYVATDTAAPYVSYSGKMYVYNSTTSTNNPPLKADGTLNTGWLEMESFAAIYTDILFADFAKVGSVVFANNWMFSQDGTKHGINDSYEDFPKTATTLDEVLKSENGFVPNFAINCETGEGYFAGGKIQFTKDEVLGDFSYQTSKDGNYYTSHRIYDASGKTIDVNLNSTYLKSSVLEGTIVGTHNQLINFYADVNGKPSFVTSTVIDNTNVFQYLTVPESNKFGYRIDTLNRLKIVTETGQSTYTYQVEVHPKLDSGEYFIKYNDIRTCVAELYAGTSTSSEMIANDIPTIRTEGDHCYFYAAFITTKPSCSILRIQYDTSDGSSFYTLIDISGVELGTIGEFNVDRNNEGDDPYESFIKVL